MNAVAIHSEPSTSALPAARVAGKQFLTFQLAGQHYAVDILQVQEIRVEERTTRLPGSAACMGGVINLRGDIVPVLDLALRLGLPRLPQSGVLIVMTLAARIVALRVDAVSDVVSLPSGLCRPAPDIGTDTRMLIGVATVDSRMLLLLDGERLLDGSLDRTPAANTGACAISEVTA